VIAASAGVDDVGIVGRCEGSAAPMAESAWALAARRRRSVRAAGGRPVDDAEQEIAAEANAAATPDGSVRANPEHVPIGAHVQPTASSR
jgi:hypothetical protein